jgi:hypothetical protein
VSGKIKNNWHEYHQVPSFLRMAEFLYDNKNLISKFDKNSMSKAIFCSVYEKNSALKGVGVSLSSGFAMENLPFFFINNGKPP